MYSNEYIYIMERAVVKVTLFAINCFVNVTKSFVRK